METPMKPPLSSRCLRYLPLLAAVCLLAFSAAASGASPVSYELKFERPNSHLLDITIHAEERFETSGDECAAGAEQHGISVCVDAGGDDVCVCVPDADSLPVRCGADWISGDGCGPGDPECARGGRGSDCGAVPGSDWQRC